MFSNRDAAVLLGHRVGVLARLAAEVGHEVAAAELVRRPPEGLRRDRGVIAGGAPSNRSGQQSASARRWQLAPLMGSGALLSHGAETTSSTGRVENGFVSA